MDDPQVKGVIGWFIRNPIAANLLMITILAMGWISLGGIRRESFPKLPPSEIRIEIPYDSGAAQETEEAVTLRVEAALGRIEDIKRVSSLSDPMGSTFTVEKETSADIDDLILQIREEIETLSLPDEAERARVMRDAWVEEIAHIAVVGNVDHQTLSQTARRVRDALLGRPEISALSIIGEWTPELVIEIPPQALARYDLARQDLAAHLINLTQSAPEGRIETATGPLVVSTADTAIQPEDLAGITVETGPDGQIVTLSQIADIRRDYETPRSLLRFDGAPAIRLTVEMSASSDLLSAARALHDTVDSFANGSALPTGVELRVWRDESGFISDRLSLLAKNGLQGMLLVAAILALFLRPRVAFWVVLGLPVCFAGALILMGPAFFDYTLNELTTFGFIVALGLVVDDAIVVGESVSDTVSKRGASPESVYVGVKSVATPTIFGMLTTIAAFYPITVIDGDLARILAQFATIVIFTLLFSMVETKLILPSHLAGGTGKARFTAVSDFCSGALHLFTVNVYAPALRVALRIRYLSLLAMVACFGATLYAVSSGTVRQAFFPDIPQRVLNVSYVAHSDLAADLFEREALRIADAGRTLQGEINAVAGHQVISAIELLAQDRSATITAELSTDVDTADILNQWRNRVGPVEGARELNFSNRMSGFPDFSVELSLPDRDALQSVSTDVLRQLSAVEGVTEAKSASAANQPQIKLHLTQLGETLGLTVDDVARQIDGLLDGVELTTFMEEGREVSVRLTTPVSNRQSLMDLPRLEISTPDGQRVQLSAVVNWTRTLVSDEIARNAQGRVVSLSASIDNSVIDGFTLRETFLRDILPPILDAHPDLTFGFFGETQAQEEASSGLVQAFALALLIIYGLLAVALRSYVQAFLVLLVVPLGLIGAVWGHWLHDLPLSILSVNGVIALSGVIVNNGLLLVSTYNAQRRVASTIQGALIDTGITRFRAVILTSATTFLGLAPLLWEISEQAQFLIPAAVSISYGMLFATLITLFIVPVLLLITRDVTGLFETGYFTKRSKRRAKRLNPGTTMLS